MILYWVSAPHFVAGFIADQQVRRSAPILKWLRGMKVTDAVRRCQSQGWYVEVLL